MHFMNESVVRRKRVRKQFAYEAVDELASLSPTEKFHTIVFLVAMNNAMAAFSNHF